MAINAISEMKHFHDDIVRLYGEYDMDLLDNLGRRNIVMSQAQEKFFAAELAKHYEGVVNDGRTGQPDIVLSSLDKELECKLTTRHKSGSISFQSDYTTLQQKGSLDYLYVIADNNFEKFAVLHFIGLTVDDFHPVANGSRGKVSMKKHVGMKKCNMLLGHAISCNKLEIAKIDEKLSKISDVTSAAGKKLLMRREYHVSTPTKYSFVLEEVSPSHA